MDENDEINETIANDSENNSDSEYENDIEELSNNDSNLYVLNTDNKITRNNITKFEISRIKGIRKEQLSRGAIKCVEGNFNNIDDIVEEEFKSKRMPLIIRRYLTNGKYEDWRLTDFDNI